MAWHEKHGTGHRYVYYGPDGKRHKTATCRTKTEARKMGEAAEVAIRQGMWLDPDKGRVTFGQYFLNDWYPARAPANGPPWHSRYMAQWRAEQHGWQVTWGDVELRSIRPTHVQRWVDAMVADGMSPSNIENRFQSFQVVLAARRGKCALLDEMILRNPCTGIEIPTREVKPVKIYEPPQVLSLVDELGEWWWPQAVFASETGMRWGEVNALTLDDFTLGWQTAKVVNTIQEYSKAVTGNGTPFLLKECPKEGNDHGGSGIKKVALTDEAKLCVEFVVRARNLGPGDRLFAAPDKTGGTLHTVGRGKQPKALPMEQWVPLRTEAFPEGYPVANNYYGEKVWKPAIARAGLPELGFHGLRASNISWLLSNAGENEIPWVMQQVGHRLLRTTQRYMAVMSEADQRGLAGMKTVKARYTMPSLADRLNERFADDTRRLA